MAKIVLNDELTYNISQFNRYVNLLDGTMQITGSFTIVNGQFSTLLETLKELTITSLKILNDQDIKIYELTDLNAQVNTIDETLVTNSMETHISLLFR